MTLVWLPPAVAATASVKWWRTLLALLPALIMGIVITGIDLSHAADPAASQAYYTPLIRQLDHRHDLANYRVEVVQNPAIHTAAYALIGHAALAGGYETQEQNALNAVLQQPGLDATSYKIWLDDNAVGYVAFDRRSPSTQPEYQLVRSGRLPYLRRVSGTAQWTLYQVQDPTPIVPRPAVLLHADQASLTMRIPCACSVPLRVRYSDFLQLATPAGLVVGTVSDDGAGWTVLRTPAAGTYLLSGSVTTPLR